MTTGALRLAGKRCMITAINKASAMKWFPSIGPAFIGDVLCESDHDIVNGEVAGAALASWLGRVQPRHFMAVPFNPLDYPIIFANPRRLTRFSAWVEHIPFAMFLVDLLKPQLIVELGTHYGDSYCAFCQAVQETRLDARCFAIDTWQGDPHVGPYGAEVLETLPCHPNPLYS